MQINIQNLMAQSMRQQLAMRRQLGISLIEIMVALVISIFLLGGVIQVYMGNRSAYRFSDAVARLQENGRFALETMTSDLRMAGYWGCAQFIPDDNEHLVNNLKLAGMTMAQLDLYGFLGNDVVWGTTNNGLNSSDSLTLSGIKPGQDMILAPYMATVESDIQVAATSSIKNNDVVILSNCQGADIFQVSSVTTAAGGQKVISHAKLGSIGNVNPIACTATGSAQCLSQEYNADAAISVLQTVTYSIQAGASGEPALWRSENGVDEELIEGVESMKILFGMDTDSDGIVNQYQPNNFVTDYSQALAVRIFIVVRSDKDGITDSPQRFDVGGVANTAMDNRLRQVFSANVALRNRVGLIP